MRTAHWTEIVIRPGRHRQEFNPQKMADLVESICKTGVIHLPVCREEEGQLVLIAGERRIRAMAEIIQKDGLPISYHHNVLPIGHVPYALWEDLDWEKAKEVELEENINRADLTWQERAKAIAELHTFKTSVDPSWTTLQTAEATQKYQTPQSIVVLEALQLDKHLDDPEISSAKTREEAIKLLKRKMEREFATAIGEMVEEELPEYRVEQKDAIHGLKLIVEGTVDVILTDPPYGVNAQKFDAGLQVTHDYNDNPQFVNSIMKCFAQESWITTKSQAHLYMFCDVRRFFDLGEIFSQEGWDVWPRPMIWKKDVGHIPKPNYGPRLQYECILFANKGNKPVTGLYSDVLDHPAVASKEHAAQKPTSLYVDLLRRSCVGGELVVDPFCGSGTIFAASISMGCAAVGFDTDPMAIGLSKETIRKCLEQKKQSPLL